VRERLDLLEQRALLVVGRHLQHEPVLDVEQDLARLAVLADERVQRVAVHHPADQPRVGRERHDRVLRDRERVRVRAQRGGRAVGGEELVDEAEELHHALVLPEVLREHAQGPRRRKRRAGEAAAKAAAARA
jgi:general stress protein YciG